MRETWARIGLGGRKSVLMAFLALAASICAQAQVDHNDNQFVYTNVVTSKLPSYLTASPNLIFNSNSGLFDFENVSTPSKPTVYVRKPPAQHGVFIFDDNPGDSVAQHALNIELYNITNLMGSKAGIRVHVDPTNTVPGNLYGIEIGNHGAATTGLIVQTAGANGAQTSGVGIQSLASGFAGILSTEGDSDPASSPVPTVGLQFNHYSTGNIMTLYQMNNQMTGDFILGNASNGGTGALLGNFLNFNVNWVPKFRVDASGNVYSAGAVWSQNGSYYGQYQNAEIFYDGTNLNLQPQLAGAGQVVVTAGSVIIPEIKANSGTRFVCVDTTGKIISQTTPCSGT